MDGDGRRPSVAVPPHADDSAPWVSNGSLRDLFDEIPVGVYRTTATGQILDANLALATILGYPNRDALLQVNAGALYAHPEDRAQWTVLMAQAGLVHDFEVRLRRPDGKIIWVRESARAVPDAEGRIQFYQGTLEDITERKAAEDAGRKSEALFHLLFEDAPIGMVLIGLDYRLFKTNKAFCELLGYTAEELSDKKFTDITHPDDVEQDVRSINARLSGGPQEYKTQTRYLRKNGETIWVHLTAKMIRDETGKLLYGLGMVEDITERQRAERALEQANEALYRVNAELEERVAQRTRELQDEVDEHRRTEIALRLSEERLQAIVDNTSAIVTLKDLEGRYLFANRQFASSIGRLPRDQLIGKRFQDVLPPSTAESAQENDREVLAAGEPREFEEQVPLADGLHTFLVIRFPLLGPDGVPYAIGTVATDITQRKRAERARGLLAAIVDSSDDAISSQTLDGVVTSWNRAAEHLYGYTAAEMVGTPISILAPPDRFHEIPALLDQIRRGETVDRYETRLQRKDGSVIDISVTISPLRDTEGVIVGASVVARDITARKRAEEAIAEARREAERANQAKSEFLSRMSHELRTPLNAILGFGQLLEMSQLVPEDQEQVQYILKGGRHLLGLINEILDVARIEAGRLSLSPEPIHVKEAIAEAVDLVRPIAAEWQVHLHAEGSEALDSYVTADRQRLKQVLLNLLSNAIKYNHRNGAVRLTCGVSGDGRLRISVHDTGPGISPEGLRRLFIPFDRIGADEKGIEGTGLGLALSQGLVQAMAGTIGVESEVGRGSTFWVELPLVERPGLESPRVHVEPPVPTETIGRLRTVLYIEDNLSSLRLVESLLRRRGQVQLLTATHGRMGLDLALEHHPDVVFLDLNLPDLHGTDVLARLKADPDTRATPVIILSADATKGQTERLLSAGAAAFLTKPIDVKVFLASLDEALGARPGA